MKGRKPVPAEIKRAQGNPGQRRLPQPVLVKGRQPLPFPVDLPPACQEFWQAIVMELERVGVLDGIDVPTLRALTIHWYRAEQARKVIARDGLFAGGSMGQIVEHPALRIEREAHSLFLRLAEHYALTPVARTRLGMAELERRSLAEELEAQIGKSRRRRRRD